MKHSFSCLLLALASLGFSSSLALAGNNTGARARLSWNSGPFQPSGVDLSKSSWNDDLSALPHPAGPSIFPIYVLLDGARDVREMAVTLRWAPADSIGCYSIVPGKADSACGWVNETPVSSDLPGPSGFGWSIVFDPKGTFTPCVTFLVSAVACGATQPADFRLVSIRVKDSLGALDSLSVVGSATLLGGTGQNAEVIVDSVLPQAIVAGRSVTLAIQGTGFVSPASVELRNPAGTLRATQVTVKTPELLSATFLPPASMAGPVDLVVRVPDGSSGLLGGAVQLTQPLDPQSSCYFAGPTETVGPRPRVAWADFDKNGQLDFAFVGFTCQGGCDIPHTDVYLWQAPGAPFVPVPGPFDPTDWGSLCIGDFDNDGDLDILTTGYDASYVARTTIYRQDAGTTFTKLHPANVLGVAHGTAQWGDYDNDGSPDILLVGDSDNMGHVTRIYHSTPSGYVDIQAGLPGLYWADAAWADYDNDGDLDFVITGNAGSAANPVPTTLLYRNDINAQGQHVFTLVNAGLTGVWKSSVAWVDLDSDGWLDLVYIGATGTDAPAGAAPVACVYMNDQLGGFVANTTTNALLPVFDGSITFGDYQTDGYPDAIETGTTGGSAAYTVARQYNSISRLIGPLPGFGSSLCESETGLYEGSATWADGDQLIVVGVERTTACGEQAIIKGYTSTGGGSCGPANQPPQAPTGLSASLVGDQLTMSWSAASDFPTPSPGLSYNLRVGTSPGGTEIVSPAALPSGYRLIPQLGNAQKRTAWTLTVPLAAAYYWTVQAIDAGYLGGAFAPEQVTPGVLGVDGSQASGLYFGLVGANPTVGPAEFELRLPQDGQVTVTICDVSGREVATLAHGHLAGGTHRFSWQEKVRGATGMYFATCRVDGRNLVRRVLVIR